MATIEIDGKTLEVEAGSMVIEAADEAGIVIPRFCYHKKLSVAANCRMCLVEIENGRKPMPACATPVTDGMKVFTKSKMALDAQKAVMEFLLINHPLDCPICDQGGECELQDVSMGYGGDTSLYSEGKRSVVDDDLGSLIATEMTRCIHCTRCVRFGEEIAGQRELGATGRGEHTQIGTFVKHNVSSEVSGNVIDLCPVGALTAKPSRFSARAWELSQHKQIAAHDCLGSNTLVHTRRNEVMRVVPNENDQINETWLSDRDRFSYVATHANTRLLKPMVKKEGGWIEVEWQEALNAVVAGFNKVIGKHGADAVTGLCSPSSTTEEAYLFQKLLRGIGVSSIDHRIHQTDFSDQDYLPMAPVTHASIADVEVADNIILLGSNISREQPLLALRVRKAALNGGQVHCLNPVDYDFKFDSTNKIIVTPDELVHQLADIVAELNKLAGSEYPEAKHLLAGRKGSDAAKAIAKSLHTSKKNVLLMGAISHNHPKAATIRSLVHLLQRNVDVSVYRLTEGANEAGCHYAGVLPHRGTCAEAVEAKGLDVQAAMQQRMAGYFLHNIEPELDLANPHQARQSLLSAEFVVVMNAFQSDSMLDYADVLLPCALSFETSGTFVNVSDQWQSFQGVVKSPEQVRPGWKILRVLGNLFSVPGFTYQSSEEVLQELKRIHNISSPVRCEWFSPKELTHSKAELERIAEWPMFRMDGTVRNAQALQNAAANDQLCIRLNSETAKKYELAEQATISQGDIAITLPVVIDERIPQGAVAVDNAWNECSDLADSFGAIELK
jgi:NADH-quinone oxidoreductase subunit G